MSALARQLEGAGETEPTPPESTAGLPEAAVDLLAEDRERVTRLVESMKSVANAMGSACRYGIEVTDGEGISFAHETMTINIGLKDILQLGLNDAETQVAFLHEAGHVVQLLQNSAEYQRTFDIARQRAAENPVAQAEPALRRDIEKLWHHFFNAFLDINDNIGIVQRRTLTYQAGGGREQVFPQVYRDRLFPSAAGAAAPDYSQDLLSVQFIDYALRTTMVPDEEPVVHPDVKAAFERTYRVYGEDITIADFIRRYVAGRGTFAEAVHAMQSLNCPLAAVFTELMERDTDEIRRRQQAAQKQPSKGGQGGEPGEPGEPSGVPDQIGEVGLGDLTEDQIKKIVDDIAHDERTPDQKAADAARARRHKTLEGAGLNVTEIKRIEELLVLCQEHIEDMTTLWGHFQQEVTTTTAREQVGFKHGQTLDIGSVVRQYGTLSSQPEEARVMKRIVPEEEVSLLPKRIRLTLVIDLSGSMDEAKRKAVQEVAYTLAESLMRFKGNQLVNLPEGQDLENITDISFDIVAFGSTTEVLIENGGSGDWDPAAISLKLVETIIDIQRKDLGGTNDAPALAFSRDAIKQEQANRDGGAQVSCIGIQIPGSLYSDTPPAPKEGEERLAPALHHEIIEPTGTFAAVWGERGKQLASLESLKPTVLHLLEEAIKQWESKEGDQVESSYFVIEITDGETQTAAASKVIIDELNRLST